MTFISNTDRKSNCKRFILESMAKRLEELSNEYSNSAEYLEYSERYIDLLKQITQALPVELQYLINEFDSLHGSILVKNQKYFYEQGFADCRILFSFLKK